MTPKNVLSAFEKTGISPFNPSKVLTKVILQEIPDLRPSSSHSVSSIFSENDVRKIRVLFQEISSKYHDKKQAKLLSKIQTSMVSLRTELAITRAENRGLRLAVTTEKRRRKRGKGLMAQLRDEDDGNAMFFSPAKIQQARDLHTARDLEKDEETKAKEAAKEAKRLAKEEAALQVEQRKGDREKARLEREKAKVEKQRKIEQEREDRLASKQLQEEAKRARIEEREQRKQSQRGSKKKSLVVVLRYRSQVTCTDAENGGTRVEEQPPQRILRHRK
ncbi:hypothetical protein Vi05172_g11830 [Venturia inaequalis]|nr:hypothetical protein Vi05172_g11830 [Venturia inaequalis]